MASKIELKEPPRYDLSLKIIEIDSLNYCSDCIYHWCSKRSKVIFCSMKTKGLFECKSCMLKLIKQYS
ncbi:MAG: hypothetical protein FK731_06070 [Asgard group archaeon]|nr:hypothetical protein [Asgard group archaeon]